ncbi:MAG: hypothetical protein IKV54_02760, partial [Clostridia bacterium]|nr:hypothetical protein [Clostridia bacterium]
ALGHDWQTDEATGIVICVRDGCGKVKDSEIPQDKNLVLGLSKIPVATPDMTTDELRDIVVAYMKLQLSFGYCANISEPDGSYGYYIKNLYGQYDGGDSLENVMIKFENGKYYGGVPYMGNAHGTLYRWLPFYDAQTGDMDWTPVIASKRVDWVDSNNDRVYPDVGSKIFGNSCSAACVWAWARVSNEINNFWTSGWIPSRGFVPVGDYKIIAEGDHAVNCRGNGIQGMCAAYAQMLRGDGLVNPGHAVMILEDPVVVYNDDGAINPYKSYVLIGEQKASFLTDSPKYGGVDLYSPMNGNGETYRVMGNYPGNTVNGKITEMKWTFYELFEDNYTPFTVPELAGTGEVEKAKLTFKYTESAISIEGIRGMTVSSNYMISDVIFNVTDAEGNLVFSGCHANENTNVKKTMKCALEGAFIENILYEDTDYLYNNLAKYTDGNYTVEITCRISTGELLSAYKGTLVE